METNCEELICRTISPLRCSSSINVIVSHYLLTALSQSAFKSPLAPSFHLLRPTSSVALYVHPQSLFLSLSLFHPCLSSSFCPSIPLSPALSLSHHTATILGSNWLNNTFRLPKTSTGKVFPPSVIKLWSDHDGFVPARMIHLQYIGLCMPTTVLFCLRYTINSKL